MDARSVGLTNGGAIDLLAVGTAPASLQVAQLIVQFAQLFERFQLFG